jgi:hypothetical protein
MKIDEVPYDKEDLNNKVSSVAKEKFNSTPKIQGIQEIFTSIVLTAQNAYQLPWGAHAIAPTLERHAFVAARTLSISRIFRASFFSFLFMVSSTRITTHS